MTLARLAAAAQHRETALGRALEESLDRIRESGFQSHLAVEGVALCIELVCMLRTPAQC